MPKFMTRVTGTFPARISEEIARGRALIEDLSSYDRAGYDAKHLDETLEHFNALELGCFGLGMTPAFREICRLGRDLKKCDTNRAFLIEAIGVLHALVEDHLASCVVFCVSDQEQLEYFFELHFNRWTEKMILVRKDPARVFGESIIATFPSTVPDLKETISCFIFDRYTACVFHLMRVVEVGVLKIARLAGMDEAMPSWWAVMRRLEAKVSSVEETHVATTPLARLITDTLANMKRLQAAWCSKILIVENKLIPIEGTTQEGAKALMLHTTTFMRTIAEYQQSFAIGVKGS